MDELKIIGNLDMTRMNQAGLQDLLNRISAIADQEHLCDQYKDMITPAAEDVLLYSAYEAGADDDEGSLEEYYERQTITPELIRYAVRQAYAYAGAKE